MSISPISSQDIESLLKLEYDLYFDYPDWSKRWKKEAKRLFKQFIVDYVKNFNQGCFELRDRKGILGAIFLLTTKKKLAIPYLHRVKEYMYEGGKNAYVSFFVIQKGVKGKNIAVLLYKEAEVLAKKLGCSNILVVIYKSPVELETIVKLGYKTDNKVCNWEILPGKTVNALIYRKQL